MSYGLLQSSYPALIEQIKDLGDFDPAIQVKIWRINLYKRMKEEQENIYETIAALKQIRYHPNIYFWQGYFYATYDYQKRLGSSRPSIIVPYNALKELFLYDDVFFNTILGTEDLTAYVEESEGVSVFHLIDDLVTEKDNDAYVQGLYKYIKKIHDTTMRRLLRKYTKAFYQADIDILAERYIPMKYDLPKNPIQYE